MSYINTLVNAACSTGMIKDDDKSRRAFRAWATADPGSAVLAYVRAARNKNSAPVRAAAAETKPNHPTAYPLSWVRAGNPRLSRIATSEARGKVPMAGPVHAASDTPALLEAARQSELARYSREVWHRR